MSNQSTTSNTGRDMRQRKCTTHKMHYGIYGNHDLKSRELRKCYSILFISIIFFDAARQCTKERTEWRELYICNWRNFTREFLLGPMFFRTALPCSGGYYLERGMMPLHDILYHAFVIYYIMIYYIMLLWYTISWYSISCFCDIL